MRWALSGRYMALVWLAFLWAIGNAVYVYLILGGARSFQVESASYILAAALLPLVFARPRGPQSGRMVLTASDVRVLSLLAIALWLIAWARFAALPFLSDDYVFLAAYRRVPDALRAGQFFRPMFALVFLALARVGGDSPVPFHVASGVLHAASAWLVYVLSRRLFGRSDAAALCAALFLANPLQMEAVLWVSGLQELLWTFFVLAALVVYTAARTLSSWRIVATAVLIACALLAKETAVASALLLPAADWTYFRMKRGRLLPAAYAAAAVLVIGYLLGRARFAPLDSAFFVAPGRYFVQKFVAAPYKFFVHPWNPAAAHLPPIVLCAASVLALATLFAAVMRGAGPTALVGPAVVLISTLPVYSYFYVRADLQAARYLYFAAIGWALLVAQLTNTLATGRRAFAAAFAALVVAMAASLQVNVKPWRTAGDIVDEVRASLRQGRAPERPLEYWQAKYGDGFEVNDGIPTVYRGVDVFVNGYPELRRIVADHRASADKSPLHSAVVRARPPPGGPIGAIVYFAARGNCDCGRHRSAGPAIRRQPDDVARRDRRREERRRALDGRPDGAAAPIRTVCTQGISSRGKDRGRCRWTK